MKFYKKILIVKPKYTLALKVPWLGKITWERLDFNIGKGERVDYIVYDELE